MTDRDHPLLPLQALVLTIMGDKCLDYNAMHKAWEAKCNPASAHLSKKRLTSKVDATVGILSSPTANTFIVVSPQDSSSKCYTFRCETDENGKAVFSSFDDNDAQMEYADRHPGTSKDSDVEDGVDPHEKHLYYNLNDRASPITTTAAEALYGIVFAGPGGVVSELKAAYDMQLSARIDESRKCLNLDCFEYKPRCIDLEAEGSEAPLPTYSDMKRFDDSINPTPKKQSMWGDDDEDSSDDEESDETKEKVEPKQGSTFTKDQILTMNYQAYVGNFASSRVLRVRLPLSNVIGIRLVGNTNDSDEDAGAVLVMEWKERLAPDNAFAARKVRSRCHKENEFALTEDWTPNKVASRASRCYLYGTLAEMKQTAALMARLCPHIATMLSSSAAASNSLKPPASLEYAASPELAVANVDAEMTDVSDDEKNGRQAKGKGNRYKMSVRDVHKLLVETELVDNIVEAESVNSCLKRAILLGHIKIDKETTKDTVMYEGSCVHCRQDLRCTISDALHQPTYGGHDYCDGGEDGGVQCPSCGEDECGGGNYITELCTGNFSFDSGKFHNHCEECPDFGTCIRDYREAHCQHCGGHYFRGMSGFSCPSCGGGKSKSLAKMDPPPLSAWDGKIDNAMEVFESQLARMDPMRATMLKAMVLGPEAALGSRGNAMHNSEQLFASMLGQMASEMMGSEDSDAEEREDGGGGSGGEECKQM